MTDLLPMLIISSIFILIFIIAEMMKRIGKFCPEATRKFVHFLGAFVSIFFPFVLTSHISVLILATTFALIMIATKKLNLLQSVHCVDRETNGAFYHPIAIYFCFLISQILAQPYFYVISILILAISDASAALVGKTYGIRSFVVEFDKKKTSEGSIIFFLTAFLITHLILLLFTQTGRLESVLIAILIALITTIFEIVSLEGSDNIFVPFATMFVLSKNLNPTPEGILAQIVYLIFSIIILLVLMRPFKKIGFSGIILLGLFTYIAFALGGISWALALFLIGLLCQKTNWILVKDESKNEIFRILPISYVLGVSILLLFIMDIFETITGNNVSNLFFIPYIYCLVSQITILRGWKRKIENDVPTKTHCSLSKSLVFTLIFTPFIYVASKDFYLIYSLLIFIFSFITDRIYWCLLQKHENWEQRQFLRTGFYLTLINSIIILTILLGGKYVFNFL